jgi:hypothetical protein
MDTANPQATEWTCRDGGASVKLVAPRVVLLTMYGRVDAGVGREAARALAEALREGPPKDTFWNLFEMEGYHSDVRTRATQALLANWSNVLSVQVVASSKIVKMGVAVANVALRGRIHSFEGFPSFERALATACAG